MKGISLLQAAGAALLTVLLQAGAWGHSSASGTVPGNGQTVSSPQMLMLSFDGAVRLVRLTVAGSMGAVDVGFVPQATASSSFHVPMPTLAAGSYRVDWTILGEDGHSVSENFTFNVDPNAPAAVMPEEGHSADGAHVH
jgi:methionine-rich copper-binding protein CopC